MVTKKLALWVRQHLAFVLLAVIFVLPALTFILGSAAILIYIYWPTNYYRMIMPSINHAAGNIVILVHGLNDNPSTWSTPLVKSLEAQLSAEREISQVIALNWNPYSANTLRCSVDGMRIGAALGEQMARSKQLHSVHLIGHSCGAFVILGLCKTLKAERSDIQIQSTYLAPANIFGGIFWNYGSNHFGSCADFSDIYIDREDTIGISSEAPSNTYGFDITDARIGAGFAVSPHVWPTIYYQQLVTSGTYPDLRSNRALLLTTMRPGDLEEVKELPESGRQ